MFRIRLDWRLGAASVDKWLAEVDSELEGSSLEKARGS